MRLSTPCLAAVLAVSALAPLPAWAQASGSTVYRCPGNLYTSELTAKQAEEKGCRTIEGAPITVIQGARPRTGAPGPAASGARPSESRIDPAQQRTRDNDSRRILESELRREEEQLGTLQREYNGGEPERRGDEKNFQKYQDRVAERTAAIARKESDIAALRREIAKLPQ